MGDNKTPAEPALSPSAFTRAFETPDSPVKVVDLSEFLSMKLPERERLLSPWLLSQSLVMIHAWRGVGKTHFALGVAHALASGGSFLGWQAKAPIPILYIDGEMSAVEMQGRLSRIVKGAKDRAFMGNFRLCTPDLQPRGRMPDLSTYEGQQQIDEITGNAQVIFVDNISCLVRRGRENESDSWQPVADWALQMRALGRSVVFLHHDGKSGGQRGTSKREDALDTVIQLKKPSDYKITDKSRFEIHFEKYRPGDGVMNPMEVKLESGPAGEDAWKIRDCDSIEEGRVIEMYKLGLNYAEIGSELGVNRSTIKRRLDKAREQGKLPAKD